MKKLLITLVVLIVIAAGGLFALAKFAPIDSIKAEAVTQVKDKTGRDLAFSEAHVTFWPNIGVQMKDVSFSNADWSSEKNMVTLGILDVKLAVMPLLHKQVEVKRFVLDQPVIYLEKSADGRMNWDFNRGDKVKAEEKSSGGSAASGYGVRLGTFEINKGQLTYVDRQKGTTQVLKDINVKVDYPDLSAPLKLDGSFDYKDKKVTLALGFEKPLELGDGKPSSGSVNVKSDVVNAAISGIFATTGTMLKDGQIEADISSLPQLAAWLGDGKKADLPFEKVSFKSKAGGSAEKMTLQDAALTLDEVSAKGDVTLDLSGARPDVTARLTLGKLNLDRFAGTEAGGKNADVGTAPKQQGWDTTPIDFSGLKAVDADLVLSTEGFSLKGVDVGPSKLAVLLKDGNLRASSSEATLFGGKFSSDISVNAAPATPTMAVKFDMDGVEAQPVLETFADFKKLSGKVDTHVDVTTAGKSQRDIINALNGSGSAIFRNGSLSGIDLVNIAKAVQGGLANFGVGEGKTDFVELGGTFKITSGVAHNDDLKMKGPLLQATGSGDIDLPKKAVKYRVIPVLTASSNVDNAKGIAIPVDISGPFSDIKARPDLGSVVKNALDNPEAIKGTIKGVKEQGKALEGSLKDLKKDPAKALGNLLGGFGGAAPAEPAVVAPEAAPAATAPAAGPQPAETP